MKEYIVKYETEQIENSTFFYGGKIEHELIRCKDCKHFEVDHFEVVNGLPLIVAHEICTRWGDGCKTSENGWCFMAEPKEKET